MLSSELYDEIVMNTPLRKPFKERLTENIMALVYNEKLNFTTYVYSTRLN